MSKVTAVRWVRWACEASDKRKIVRRSVWCKTEDLRTSRYPGNADAARSPKKSQPHGWVQRVLDSDSEPTGTRSEPSPLATISTSEHPRGIGERFVEREAGGWKWWVWHS
jgi:hypothetical protein